MKQFISALLFLFFTFTVAPGEEVKVPGPDYYLDLPEGWRGVKSYNMDTDQWDLSFTNRNGSAFMNIVVFPKEQFNNARDMFYKVKKSLNASGEGAPFNYSGMNSYLADLTLTSRGRKKRGYFLFINGTNYDYSIITFTDISLYKRNADEILSAIDSFSTDKDGRLKPGPISQFYYPTDYSTDRSLNNAKNIPFSATINLGKESYNISFYRGELEATQVLVEREARILSTYRAGTPLAIRAWKRFYRMIYRDNYHRLDDFAKTIVETTLKDGHMKKPKMMEDLVSWIQAFKYSRTETISDLLSPLSTAATQSGDCDSRSMLMVILARHMNINAVLLVSSKYSHSAVGLDVSMDGAKIQYGEHKYLYTEMTEKVKIGMVPQSMADPSGWIVVDF